MYTLSRGEDMIVYWDLVAAWNFTLDYLLLLATMRLAGQTIKRKRLAAAALLGAGYAVLTLAEPRLLWVLLPVALIMCRVAFGRVPRFLKLGLLFLLLSCSLGGAVLLLGRLSGGMTRLAYGMVFSILPWGVFCGAAVLSYVLLTVVFRGSARHDASDFVQARVSCGGRTVELRLLRDTGNALTDPLTGEGVPVVEESALAFLLPYVLFTDLRVGTVGGGSTLRAFRCDALEVNGRDLGARLIALTHESLGGAYQGLWFAEETEERQHDVAAMVG